MEIIPAIDLLDGQCVRLNQGDYNKVTQFSSNPVEQALEWQKQGAKRLHLVDLDGARTGLPKNDLIIKKIIKALNIPIQIGGGVRSKERAIELLNYGVDKIIFGTVAIEKPEIIKNLSKEYPNKIILGVDSKGGKVATSGWTKGSNITAIQLVESYNDSNIDSIIATDITKDGTLNGPNILELENLAEYSRFPIIASGGIGSVSDIISLTNLKDKGIIGMIIGRSLYDGTVNLKEALKVIEGININDTNINPNLYA